MVFGGALGNLYDRIYFRAVPDFIDLHIENLHWFVFNIADIFITLGVFMLILLEIFFSKKNDSQTLFSRCHHLFNHPHQMDYLLLHRNYPAIHPKRQRPIRLQKHLRLLQSHENLPKTQHPSQRESSNARKRRCSNRVHRSF